MPVVIDPIPLQKTVVYGPILSRRLGRSLGINILSPYQKVCSFDCVYCQYGRTSRLSQAPAAHLFFDLNEIEREVQRALRTPHRIDYVTISGNGEPCVHPRFPEIVRLLKGIVQKNRPTVKLALFSNSSHLAEENVAAAIQEIDEPIFKLDCVLDADFLRINRPAGNLGIDSICRALIAQEKISLQTLWIGGENGNSSQEAVNAWVQKLSMIKPKTVYVSSSDHDFQEVGYQKLKPAELNRIAKDAARRLGMDIRPIW